MSTSSLRAWLTPRRVINIGMVLVLAVTTWLTVVRPAATQQFTAYFDSATKLHPGDQVTVLDVRVGKVVSVTPEDDRVRVQLEVDSDQKVPRDARATILAPTMVSVRRVELSPVYDRGPALGDGDEIPLSRTAVPVEWNEVQGQLTRLATALGPQGADKEGALGNLLRSTSANLDGQGEQLGQTLTSMAEALQTLSDNRGELFATVRNLDVFVEALASSDRTVREFNTQLGLVSRQLGEDSDVLVAALRSLSRALADLDRFVDQNQATTVRTVAQLQRMTRNLSGRRQRLADILQSAPTALSNYYNIYYPDARAMTGTFVGQFFDSPAVFVCSALYSMGGKPSDCQKLLEPIAKHLDIPVSPIGLNPVERDGGSQNSGGTPSGQSPSSAPSAPAPSGGDDLDLLGGMMLGLAP